MTIVMCMCSYVYYMHKQISLNKYSVFLNLSNLPYVYYLLYLLTILRVLFVDIQSIQNYASGQLLERAWHVNK